eukprot:scaffold46878_cov72-Cyclotella_meneghiniana.AAC.1
MFSSKALLLFPCLCFCVILYRWESSDEDLKLQLTSLRRQLQDFDNLKEEYIRDLIEETWDSQRLSELDDRRATLSGSLAQMSEAYKHSAGALKENNKHMSENLSSMMQRNSETREQDAQIVHQLEAQSREVHEQESNDAT